MRILLFLLLAAMPMVLQAQGPALSWQKSVGGPGSDYLNDACPTSDGGYIVIGTTDSSGQDVTGHHGWTDAFVCKFSSTNVLEWKRCYGGTDNDAGLSIKQTSDGGYIFAGYTGSQDGDITSPPANISAATVYAWVVRLNGQGSIQWQQFIRLGQTSSIASTVIQTKDGGFVLVGSDYISGTFLTYDDGLIAKLAANGAISWTKTVAGNYHDELEGITQTTDGGYVVAGRTASDDMPGYHSATLGITYDVYVSRLNAMGDTLWRRVFGGAEGDEAHSVIQTGDGGFLVAAHTGSQNGDVTANYGTEDIWLLKLSPTGALQWQKTYGSSWFDAPATVIETADGFLVGGHVGGNDGNINGNHGGHDAWLFQTNSTGSMQWQKCYGGSQEDGCYAFRKLAGGDYLLAGRSLSSDGDLTTNHGDSDYWVARLKSSTQGVALAGGAPGISITLSPNPVADQLSGALATPLAHAAIIVIVDALGRVVNHSTIKAQSTGFQVDASGWAAGVYHLELRSEQGTASQLVFAKQ